MVGPIRGVFGCGCDRVGVRDFRVLRSATGMDGAGYPLEERVSHAGVFWGRAGTHIGAW